jgi:hypothetical protein
MSISFFIMFISFLFKRYQFDACFSTSVRRECDERAEMRERRQLATTFVEEIFLLAPELSDAVSCW